MVNDSYIFGDWQGMLMANERRMQGMIVNGGGVNGYLTAIVLVNGAKW